MVDEHFGDSVMLRAKARQGLVVATHPAIETVLAAIIREFDDAAKEYMATELFNGYCGGPSMQTLLLLPPRVQPLRTNSAIPVHWRSVKGFQPACANEIVGGPPGVKEMH